MKNFLFTCIITLSLFACSSDDNSTSSTNDNIVGKWSWGSEVYILADGSEIEFEASDCDAMTTTEFKSDGTLEQVTYYENPSNDCVIETITLEYGYWEKLSNGNYKMTSKYPNQSEEVGIEEIEFISSTQFRYIEYDNGTYDDQNIDIEYEYRNKVN